MVPAAGMADAMHLDALVRPTWPPLRHVQRGWDALTSEEQQQVHDRVEAVLAAHEWGDHPRDALLQFFAFLAQVETIAIEIPLRFLPECPEHLQPMLRRQLVDEVFHSTLFSRLAHELAHPHAAPPAPLPSAEELLDQIRAEEDMALSATLLNLVAEGWIETIFEHAAGWGVADAVFQTVLEDETRHVHEAQDYNQGMDPEKARAAVHRFESDLVRLGAEPRVMLSLLQLAGQDGYQAMVQDLHDQHRRHLAQVDLEPSEAWQEQDRMMRQAMAEEMEIPRPAAAEDTPWRTMARKVWDTPRDPTMQGQFHVPVGHIPKRLLTPVLVAAIGRAWHDNPRLNRIVSRDRVWTLPSANVGVRVLVAEDELATVVITDAHTRSVRDISRMVIDGYEQLRALRTHRRKAMARASEAAQVKATGRGGQGLLWDPESAAMLPPEANQFSVALSNPGKFGLVEGAGAFSGDMAPSSDITCGLRRRMPKWYGVAYLPAWHVTLGCLQDHRIFDGREAGLAMTALQEQLSRRGVKEILRTEDTLEEPDEEPVYDERWFQSLPAPMRTVGAVGFDPFLTKYLPYVLGGVGLGALGVGAGYLLYKTVGDAAMASVPEGGEVTVTEGEDADAETGSEEDGSGR